LGKLGIDRIILKRDINKAESKAWGYELHSPGKEQDLVVGNAAINHCDQSPMADNVHFMPLEETTPYEQTQTVFQTCIPRGYWFLHNGGNMYRKFGYNFLIWKENCNWFYFLCSLE
jgi:hypothetical protein